MGLTPEDVRQKGFRVVLRGYAVPEVDAFLDQVEAELTARAGGLPEAGPAGTSPSGPDGAPALPAGRTRADGGPLHERLDAERETGAPVEAAGGRPSTDRALRTLVLAEQTAERLLTEAEAEARELTETAATGAAETRREAEAEAAALVVDSRRRAEALLDGARAEAESRLSAARTEAERLLQEARASAAEAEREAFQRREQQLRVLDRQREDLESAVRELEVLERTSREGVRALLEQQVAALRGLQERPSSSGSTVLAALDGSVRDGAAA